MPLTTDGKARVAALLNNEVVDPFDTTNCFVGVGDSAVAFDVAQTDLQAATNKLRIPATSVTRVDNTLTIVGVFDDAEANFAWNEAGLFDDLTAGTMLSREVSAMGTKASGVWTLTITAPVG